MLAVYLVGTLIYNQVQITAKRQELSDVQEQITQKQQENEELERLIGDGSGNDDAIIERAARDDLGYARPSERIFTTSAGSNRAPSAGRLPVCGPEEFTHDKKGFRALQFEVGSILEGKVTGVKKFGAFVALPEGKTGMVHISEVSNEFIQDLSTVLEEGQTVKVKVINIAEDGKIALSIKRTLPQQPVRPGPSRAAGPAGRAARAAAASSGPMEAVYGSPSAASRRAI